MFKPGDKVCVKGLAMSFVVVSHSKDGLVKLLIEGESTEALHHIVYARPEVLLLNNIETCHEEGWL